MGYHFWAQISKRVMPKLPENVLGVWLADNPNGAGGGVWPPMKVSSLPKNAFTNVYQSLKTAVTPLSANMTTVVSIAGDFYRISYFFRHNFQFLGPE